MILGIDFGTTRTVVAAADRGNYPLIGFETQQGDMQQWYPSLAAARGERIVYALEALEKRDQPGWRLLRSLKRRLAEAGPDTPVAVGDCSRGALELLTGYLSRLRRDLYQRSNLDLTPDEPLEAFVAVPATANSNQRFLTIEAFRRAGFRIIGMVSEPSAAGIEYAHRYGPKKGPGRKDFLVLYDLGGGTFDASVIAIKNRAHEVLTDEGIARLGGDDFDEILLELALSKTGADAPLDGQSRFRLLDQCRELKEQLHPNTRNILVDLTELGAGEAVVPAAEFYQRCQPLIERTVEAVHAAVRRTVGASEDTSRIAAIYLVGGSAALPAVQRLLRERYGRQVRRSPYPFGATAIGLAIAADSKAGYTLQERFTRHFGVWREDQAGARIVFDPIFRKDTLLPSESQPALAHVRVYNPAHNIGHFRYLECSRILENGQPGGDVTLWEEIFFPFESGLQDKDLSHRQVRRNEISGQVAEERYTCDPRGIIQVAITNKNTGFSRTYRLRN